MRNKKVLYIASIDPFKTGGGGQATKAYMQSVLDLFGEENVDIMIGEEYSIPKNYMRLNYCRIGRSSFIKKVLNFLLSMLSRFTSGAIGYVKRNREKYSLIIFNRGDIAGIAAKKIKALGGCKVCVIHHNFEVEYFMDNKGLLTLYGKWDGLIKKVERTAYKNADINLFLAPQDKEKFQKEYGNSRGKNIVIGCYETKDALQPVNNETKKDFDFSISGTLANYQTYRGIEDLKINYLDCIKKYIPHPSILLTGRKPSPLIFDIQEEFPNIFNIVPNPEDIFAQVCRGCIYICPTNIGGGLKLRAMDGLKCGLPVLVHEVSARGYDAFWDKPYFKIYNDKESFAKGLSQIILLIKTDSDLGESIKRDFYQYFGYQEGKHRLEEALLQ